MQSFRLNSDGSAVVTNGDRAAIFNDQDNIPSNVLSRVQDLLAQMSLDGVTELSQSGDITYKDGNATQGSTEDLDFFMGNFDALYDSLYNQPLPPNELVNRERDIRVNTARDFIIPGYANPVSLSGFDEKNLVGLVPFCQLQASLGNGSETLVWRDNSNTEHTLSYEEVITLYSLALQYKQQVYEASWVLKGMDPLPQDYKNDSYWP